MCISDASAMGWDDDLATAPGVVPSANPDLPGIFPRRHEVALALLVGIGLLWNPPCMARAKAALTCDDLSTASTRWSTCAGALKCLPVRLLQG